MMRTLLVLLFTSLFTLTVHAEQKLIERGYEVHFNAFNSSFITPEVAAANGIVRSKVRALVNVAVFKLEQSGDKTAVRANIKGQASNLLQQIQTIEFKPIIEGDAIYYIGGFRFSEEERMTIELEVTPDPNQAPIQVSFNQTFYTE
ncbi:MAG: DUF4426 domain-containing protein [Marinobacterium sp.]